MVNTVNDSETQNGNPGKRNSDERAANRGSYRERITPIGPATRIFAFESVFMVIRLMNGGSYRNFR